jgi:hypothetical protein
VTEGESPLLAPPPSAALPTDDWPFLYLPARRVPRAYLIALALLGVVSVALLRIGGVRFGRWSAFEGHLFFLGAAFLLMEVYAINRLALLFGTTWVVSAVTIAAVLGLAMAASLTVMVARPLPPFLAYLGLALALLFGFWTGPELVLGRGLPLTLGYAVALLLPVYFGGLVFAASFRRAAAGGPALGVNILGAVLGGWVEYSTMAIGIRSLALVALAFYLLAFLFQLRGERAAQGGSLLGVAVPEALRAVQR